MKWLSLFFLFLAGQFAEVWTSEVRAYELKELLSNRLDPAPKYLTTQTQHFEIHFPLQLKGLASRIALVAESSYLKVTQALKIKPTEITHIVLSDRSDVPNVYTFVHPMNQIFLDVSLPHQAVGLNDFGEIHDWYLTHEFTHSVELQMQSGLYSVLATLFGTSIRPQLTLPIWLKEGLAVYNESTLTTKGRGESSTYQMMVRAAAEENLLENSEFAREDTVFSSENKKWPWSIRPYLYGYYLVRTVARKSPDALARMVQNQSLSFPFDFSSGLAAAGFFSYSDLWRQMITDVKTESQKKLQEIRKKPLTSLEYLTQTGQLYYGLTLSPNGQALLVTRDHPDYENSILQFNLKNRTIQKPKILTSRSTGYQTSFAKSGVYIAFDQTSKSNAYYQISDIHILDVRSQQLVTLSPNLHARDPDIHPDGQQLVIVTNRDGKNQLVMMNTAWENSQDLLGDVGYRRISSPRYSPDGKKIVFTIRNELTGGEDLGILTVNGPRQLLISNGSQNRAPSWSKDGKKIYFSSDRTGVFNVYAFDLAKKTSTQLSNVTGGLFEAVVDRSEEWVYTIAYRAKGYDVARFRLNKTPLFSSTLEKSSEISSGQTPLLPRQSELTKATDDYSGTGYLKPHYLTPSFLFRPGTRQYGLSLGSVDPLYFQHYDLNVRYDTATKLPVGSFVYYNAVHSNAFDFNVTHDSISVKDFTRPLRTLQSQLALNIPLDPVGNQFYLRPSVLAQSTSYIQNSLRVGPSLDAIYEGEFQEIGYTFAEHGNHLSIGLNHLFKLNGGADATTAAHATFKNHLPILWPRHVLHFTLAGASYLTRTTDENSVFTVGGTSSFPYENSSGLNLFGTSPNAFTAKRAAVATAHYTFSLLDIQRGMSAFPFYFGRLSAGIQAQALAINSRDLNSKTGIPLSAGIALYQNIFLGHIFNFQTQLGVYRGSSAIGGETQVIFLVSSE